MEETHREDVPDCDPYPAPHTVDHTYETRVYVTALRVDEAFSNVRQAPIHTA